MKKYLKMIATVICMTLLAGCQNTEETSALPETIKDTEIQEECTEELTADWKQAYKAFIQSGAHIGGDSDDLYCIQSEADAVMLYK